MPHAKFLFLALPLLLATGCAGHLYHDRESAMNGAYFLGKSIPSARYVFGPSRPDKEVRQGDEWLPDVIMSAYYLAQNPDYYTKSTIGGSCILGNAETVSLQALCTNVTFVVSDADGREVARVFSDTGTFHFFSESGKVYFISVLAGERKLGRAGPVRMGDEVVIRANGGNRETAQTSKLGRS